jgi:hypothetical protein
MESVFFQQHGFNVVQRDVANGDRVQRDPVSRR